MTIPGTTPDFDSAWAAPVGPEPAAVSCCSTAEQTACCAVSEKAACCGAEATAAGGCGCR